MAIAAQSSLLNSSVLVVGAGGLGSPALLYLAACGVGNDKLETKNLYPYRVMLCSSQVLLLLNDRVGCGIRV